MPDEKSSGRTTFQQDLHIIRTGFPQPPHRSSPVSHAPMVGTPTFDTSGCSRLDRRFGRCAEAQVFDNLPKLILDAADGAHILLRQCQQALMLRSCHGGCRIGGRALVDAPPAFASIDQGHASVDSSDAAIPPSASVRVAGPSDGCWSGRLTCGIDRRRVGGPFGAARRAAIPQRAGGRRLVVCGGNGAADPAHDVDTPSGRYVAATDTRTQVLAVSNSRAIVASSVHVLRSKMQR